MDLGVDGALGQPLWETQEAVYVIEEIGPAEGGKGGVVGLEEVIVEGVDMVSQGEGFSDARVPCQEQDAASSFDIVKPCHTLFEGLGMESILCFYVFVEGEALEAEPSQEDLSFLDPPFVEGEVCGDGFGPEGACVFPFVHELDSAHPDAVIVEEKRIGVIDGVTDLDALTDIGGWDLVDGALEADGGIVIDDAFVADKEDLVELCLGKPPDGDSGDGCIVAVNGPLTDAGVDLVVVVVPEPEPEGLIELVDG